MVYWTPSMSTGIRGRPWSIPAAKPLKSAAIMAEYSWPVKMREDLGGGGKQVWTQVLQQQCRFDETSDLMIPLLLLFITNLLWKRNGASDVT